MQLDLATAEYIGAREQQQDLAAALPLTAGALLVLADGLGGHESGADASRIVVTTFKEAGAAGRFRNPANRRQALREVLELANARIAEGVDPAHGHRGMASTVVAAVVENRELRWVSVGDSHLYVWRAGRLHKLNEDHSQAGLMIRSGQYQQNDPEVQAVKSVLVSALTGRRLEIVDLPQSSFRLEPGDVLMLASDGLNTLSDDEIEQIIDEIRDHGAIKLSTTLLESVRNRRMERQDNTTVVVARILEPARIAAPAPPPAPVRRPASAVPDVIEDTSEERTQRVTPETDRIDNPVVTTNLAAHPKPVSAEESMPSADRAAAHDDAALPPVVNEASPTNPEAQLKEAASAGTLKPRSTRPEPARLGASKNNLERDAPVALGAAPADVPPDVLLPPARHAAPAHDPAGWSHGARSVLLVVLLLLLVSGIAIAAIRPEWLSGVVPGFGESEILPPAPALKTESDAIPKTQPGSEQDKGPEAAATPGAEPAIGPASKLTPAVPQPVITPNGLAKTPSAFPPAEPFAKTPAPGPSEGTPPAQVSQPTVPANPQLVEPERPATRPGERR